MGHLSIKAGILVLAFLVIVTALCVRSEASAVNPIEVQKYESDESDSGAMKFDTDATKVKIIDRSRGVSAMDYIDPNMLMRPKVAFDDQETDSGELESTDDESELDESDPDFMPAIHRSKKSIARRRTQTRARTRVRSSKVAKRTTARQARAAKRTGAAVARRRPRVKPQRRTRGSATVKRRTP
jgi:hypothetical protein